METNFRVTGFKVDESFVTATVIGEDTETDILINREKIDEWITEGNGAIFTYIGDEQIKIPIDEYWDDSSINNEPHITDIQDYFCRHEESKIYVIEKLRIEKIMQLITGELPLSKEMLIKEAIHSYGMACRQWMNNEWKELQKTI